MGFINDAGEELKKGQEVILKADGTIDKRDAGSETPIGIVMKGGADGERILVKTFYTALVYGIAKGGAINAGSYLKQDSTKDAYDRFNYLVIAGTDKSISQAITAADEDAVMTIGVIDGIYVAGSDAAYTQQTIAAYTADDESVAYSGATTMTDVTDSSGGTAVGTLAAVSGTGDDGDVNDNFAELATQVAAAKADILLKATLADLNALRVAYETLRASYDDMRTQLIASGLVTT